MSNMVSDVWQWGFRLFDKKQPEVKVAEKSGPEKSLLAETEELPSQNNQDASPPLPSEPAEPAKTKEEADTDGVHSGETLIAAEPPVVITSDDQPVVEESSDTSRQATAEVPAEISFQPASAVTSESETSSDTDSGSTAKTGLKLEGDLGQGNPEDKELYTTRE